MEAPDWWWLSYACEEKGFLGVVIIAASDFISACKVSTFLGLSPGGQASGMPVNWGGEKIITISKTFRLLGYEEATMLSNTIDHYLYTGDSKLINQEH